MLVRKRTGPHQKWKNLKKCEIDPYRKMGVFAQKGTITFPSPHWLTLVPPNDSWYPGLGPWSHGGMGVSLLYVCNFFAGTPFFTVTWHVGRTRTTNLSKTTIEDDISWMLERMPCFKMSHHDKKCHFLPCSVTFCSMGHHEHASQKLENDDFTWKKLQKIAIFSCKIMIL